MSSFQSALTYLPLRFALGALAPLLVPSPCALADVQPPSIPNARIRLTDNSGVETPLADCLKAAFAKQGAAGKNGEISSFGDPDYLYDGDGDAVLNVAQVPAVTTKKDDDQKSVSVRIRFQAPLSAVWRVYYYGDGQDAMQATSLLPVAEVIDKKDALLFKLDLTSCRDLFIY